MPLPKGFEHAGIIGVDAGLCWIGDPCYVVAKDCTEVFTSWRKFCTLMGETNVKQFNYKAGHAGLGVCVGTGDGDGTYRVVMKRDKSGRVMEVRVAFDDRYEDRDEQPKIRKCTDCRGTGLAAESPYENECPSCRGTGKIVED